MIKKIICAVVLSIAPMALATESSAGDCYRGGYRGHHGVGRPVVRSYSYSPYGYNHGYGAPVRGVPYGGHYGPRYGSAYRYGYGGYGGYRSGYYTRGSAIGINTGRVSLYFGF